MASFLPGYEYDIFISYRQKDNKHDGWVTDFVNQLKGELESTFKEEISVYFDINPHDGLLETHDVDASLKEKLKCLIFIPVISRTYCDPKSFAWEHEFKAFMEIAKQDQFGMKVKLPGGNVANRILPVQIHDLDSDDKALLEKELGGVLRGIEFIYKEPGVNRPLTSDDDENLVLNRKKYRNQINKVANAIKDIITGLRTEPASHFKEKAKSGESEEKFNNGDKDEGQKRPPKPPKTILLSAFLIIAVLVVGLILVYNRISSHSKMENLKSSDGRISVVVMPFINMTGDISWDVWQNGIQDEIITSLTNYDELKVRQTESVTNILQSKGFTEYASITPSFASSISQKLDANVVICGSLIQAYGSIRLNAQMIDSKKNELIKSFQVDGAAGKILRTIDSLSWLIKNYLAISKTEKSLSLELQHYSSTNSSSAYEYFIYGQKAFVKSDWATALKMYSKAFEIDSNFNYPEIMLPFVYRNQGLYEDAKKWCLKIYKKRDQMPLKQRLLTNYEYALFFETNYEAIKCLEQLIESDDQIPIYYLGLLIIYNRLHQYNKAIIYGEKVNELYKKWDSKPESVWAYTNLGFAYHNAGNYKEEKALYKKAEQDFIDDPLLIKRQAVLFLSEKDTTEANKYIDKYISVKRDNSVPEANIMTDLAGIYYEADIAGKAEKFYRESLRLEPENPLRMNALACFLIDNRGIDEGINLINNALNLIPDNFYFMDTKGWGLYKQGKYQEALEEMNKCWELRPYFEYDVFLHLQEVRKAVANKTN